MVGCRLGRRIGTVRSVRGVFRKKPLGTQTSVYLVGADMVKQRHFLHVGPGQFQQVERPHDVGLNKSIRRGNGPVHMGFGGKMADAVDSVFFK